MNCLRVTCLVVLLLVAGLTVAEADDGGDVGAGSNYYFVSVHEHQAGSEFSDVGNVGQVTAPVTSTVSLQCAIGGDQTCAEPAHCDDGTVMTMTTYFIGSEVIDAGTNCPVEAGPAPEPQVTPGLVAAAFQRLPLPASDLQVQPPNGRTLVNFATNFYTDNGEFTRTVTLLGRRVELRIWPARYGWRFGDGATRWTTSAGSAYPDLEITHRYLRRGRVSPSVDTTYAAQFRVGGGAWRDVNGTVTIPGAPQGLQVVTARPVLVGD